MRFPFINKNKIVKKGPCQEKFIKYLTERNKKNKNNSKKEFLREIYSL